MAREVRIVHTSDLHLDASFRATGVPSARARERCVAHLEAFDRVVDLARSEDADVLLFAGDLFEASHTRPATVRHVAKRLGAWGKPVCIAPGNHDPIRDGSVYSLADWPENVTLFGGNWNAVAFGDLDLTVYGRGFTEPEDHERLVDGLAIESSGVNVVLAHGSDESSRPDRHQPYRPFTVTELDRLPVAYVALGHFHGHAVLPTRRVAAAYSGSPIAQGFQDHRLHGALFVRLTRDTADLELRSFPSRRFLSIDVDVTGCDTEAEVAERAHAALVEHQTTKDFVRLILRGSVAGDLDLDPTGMSERLAASAHVLELRNESEPEYDLESVAQEGTVRGNFVRTLFARMQDAPDDERETIRRAIYFGLDALTGRPQVR